MSDHPRVILVEDNPDDEFFFTRQWDKAGCRGLMTILRDGEELVAEFGKIIAGRKPEPCLIILDSVVQPLSAGEISDAVMKLPATIPLVLLTGAENSPLEGLLCANRLVKVIQKPITPEALVECLREHCPDVAP